LSGHRVECGDNFGYVGGYAMNAFEFVVVSDDDEMDMNVDMGY
jgi:hypothetical protein